MNRKYDSRQCFLPVEKKATWHEIVQIKKQQQSAIPIKEAAAPPQTVQHHQPYQLREKTKKSTTSYQEGKCSARNSTDIDRISSTSEERTGRNICNI